MIAEMENINEHVALSKYKETTKRILKMSYPHLTDQDFDTALDYSIRKRYNQEDCTIYNNYKNKEVDMNLLSLTDYIYAREPIVTAYGVLFRKHGEVPNPLLDVIQGFLDNRNIHKGIMFDYLKKENMEMYERYNLMQQLDKIDVNGIYGAEGQYTCLIYNLHVATSITSQGRSLVSAAGLQFEQFLANNVKFGSLNEVVTFIDNIVTEKPKRMFRDDTILDDFNAITAESCFAKIILTCGYRWIPDSDEMDIIYNIINNLSQEDLNRVYYKNNLYDFMSNSSMITALKNILISLKNPYLNPLKCPEEIRPQMDAFTDILLEYVYYSYQTIDRIDRMDNMIKSVCLISDTDSTIISLDAWYNFALDKVIGIDMPILHQKIDPIIFEKVDEFGDYVTDWNHAVKFDEPQLDYDFYTDEIVELERYIDPVSIIPQDNLRYSIINIMTYVLDAIINDHMLAYTKASHSYSPDRDCKIIMKNEFLFKRALLTSVKKSYAAIQEIQEGNKLDDVLDVKGIAAIVKSSASETTRNALKKILYEDILNSDEIDQIKVIKDMAILEKKIWESLKSGSKEYYKPLVVKAASVYTDPMSMQGIKASVAWNNIKEPSLQSLDLADRNSIRVAKVIINEKTLEKIKDSHPDIYHNVIDFLNDPKYVKFYKGNITAIAIPDECEVPDWVVDLLDYNTIISDNLGGFPLESIGIQKLSTSSVNMGYTNILKL